MTTTGNYIRYAYALIQVIRNLQCPKLRVNILTAGCTIFGGVHVF